MHFTIQMLPSYILFIVATVYIVVTIIRLKSKNTSVTYLGSKTLGNILSVIGLILAVILIMMSLLSIIQDKPINNIQQQIETFF